MSERPSPTPNRRPAGQRTPAQMMVLGLAILLGMAWLVLAASMLRGNRPPGAQPPARSPSPLAPVVCAQTAVSDGGQVISASVMRVLADGWLEFQAEGVSLQAPLAGIALPEDATLREQALALLRTWLEGQSILLVTDPAAGASLDGPRYVFRDSQFINYELARAGLASVAPGSDALHCANALQQAEQQARIDQAGIWQPAPVPTLTFVPFVTLDPSARPDCDCSPRPTCGDFSTHDEAQACFNACNDYNSLLDEDHDGIACEALP